jgi:23S rRNA pseudouridine1911/1915/1917 synthase
LRLVLSDGCSLIGALEILVPGASRRTLRQMLDQGRVRLNGEVCKVASHAALAGDVVEVGDRTSATRWVHGIEVIFEDEDLLIIHKPEGLLTVATLHERERTAYAFLRAHLKEREPDSRLFIVHRLDKFVSGLLVFAKSEAVKSTLQVLFSKHDVKRKYWAIVEGRVEKEKGTVRSRLAEDRSKRMHSTGEESEGKDAVTHYRVIRRFSNLTALEVTLETGRKNQIRVHMSELGHPIVGDKSYGSTIDPMGRMGLHAFCLGFVHPRKKTQLFFKTDVPPAFKRYLPRLRARDTAAGEKAANREDPEEQKGNRN